MQAAAQRKRYGRAGLALLAVLLTVASACTRTPEPGAVATVVPSSPSTAAPGTPGTTSAAPTQAAGDDLVSPAPSPAPSALPNQDARLSALQRLFDRRAAAVQERDRTPWLADLEPTAAALRAQQQQAWDGLVQVPFALWTASVTDLAPADLTTWGTTAAADPSAAVATVTIRYRISGADPTDVLRGEEWLVVQGAGGERLAARRAGRDLVPPQPTDPWDLGPLQVRVGKHSTVVAAVGALATGRSLEGWSALADRSALVVDGVWGKEWPRRPLVLVPSDTDAMAALLGRAAQDRAGLSGLAAVTTGQTRPGAPVSANRVVIGPRAFPTLSPAGQRVVLTHEMTHLATRSSAPPRAQTPTASEPKVPAWLSEGFADYVGYLHSGIPVAAATPELHLARTRGELPSSLPVDAELSVRSGGSPAAYEAAWLAARMVAARYGEAALVRFYRTSQRAGTTAGLRDLGLTAPQFEDAWRDYVRAVTG